jgi:hypothetical protein
MEIIVVRGRFSPLTVKVLVSPIVAVSGVTLSTMGACPEL